MVSDVCWLLHYRLHSRKMLLFYLHGPFNSGKSTFANTITAMLGEPLASSANFLLSRNLRVTEFRFGPFEALSFCGCSPIQQKPAHDTGS